MEVQENRIVASAPPTKSPTLKSEYISYDKNSKEAISNIYELPSTEQIVRYFHAYAGFPTKPKRLKAIKGGNFATSPHLSEEAVRAFP